MPSFTRRVARPAAGPSTSQGGSTTSITCSTSSLSSAPLPGTRPCPSAPTLRLLPSGLGSLDDLLGGGLPVGNTLLLLAPDAHTAWGRLVARHVAAQGLVDAQRCVVVAEDSSKWASGMPWVDSAAVKDEGGESDGEGAGDGVEAGRTRIAWRYDSMGKFQTTVGASSSVLAANITLPSPTRTHLEADRRLVHLELDDDVSATLTALQSALDAPFPGGQPGVTRVAVDLDGTGWTTQQISRALLGIRALVRSRPAAAVITLPARLSTPKAAASLGWAADACLSFTGFGATPDLAKVYHPAHGLLTVHSLPTTHHLLAPALRHSTLLGVSDGASENNLGFRLKRKRFVIETVHLGIEGGEGERRTEPKQRAVAPVPVVAPGTTVTEAAEGVDKVQVPSALTVAEDLKAKPKKPRARVRFGDDEVAVSVGGDHKHEHKHGHKHESAAPRVAIRHDRPDLYEF